ncbi:hypothetical protein AB0I72_19400 [Nocardiopsis sp. NPDC049922]|uniref:hypothetical protein n=1 Tax=Nocardiopsis sp. NPDC049922 TaxID=3155157 RepID=UPI0033DC2DC3
MTRTDHADAARELLAVSGYYTAADAATAERTEHAARLIAAAQVHATLALVAHPMDISALAGGVGVPVGAAQQAAD